MEDSVTTAHEIEFYLLQKFQSGLDVKDKNISKIPRYNQFKEIKALLEDVFASSLLVDSSLRLRDKLYYLNNVLSECKMLRGKRGFNTPEELLAINRIRMELNKINKELKRAVDSRRASSNGNAVPSPNDGHARPEDDREISTHSVDASKVYGFEDNVLSIKKLLFEPGSDDRFKAVGVVGRDGIGKTTLCQLIFNDQEVKEKFLPRIWVCMARRPDDDEDSKVALVKRMLMHLGVGEETVKSIFEEKNGLQGLMWALHCQLEGKRYLIVLDDAKDTDSWYGPLKSCRTRGKKWDDEFAFGMPKEHGGRVIVTSRDEELAKMMVGKENLYNLQPLSNPDDCWAIFKDADTNDWVLPNPPNLEDLKSEVKKKCGGLPLAAKMMGQALQEEDLQQHE